MTQYKTSFRRLLMVYAMAGVFISSLPAQINSEDRSDRAAAHVKELKERLKLTPEQVERALPVLEREVQQMRVTFRDFDRKSASMREKRKVARQVKSIRDSADEQLRGILTPAQMDQLKRIREERTKQMRARGREDA